MKEAQRRRKEGDRPLDIGERDELQDLGHLFIVRRSSKLVEPLPEALRISPKQVDREELINPLLLGIVRGSRRGFRIEGRDGAVGYLHGGVREMEVGGGAEEGGEGGAVREGRE